MVFSDEKRASDELSRDLECKRGPAKEPVAGVGKGERGGRNWVGSLAHRGGGLGDGTGATDGPGWTIKDGKETVADPLLS